MIPFLKWAGGKRQLLNIIIPIIKKNLKQENTYFEVFVGAGAVFLELQHHNVIINDSNTELMITYQNIKTHPKELLKKLSEYKEKHDKDFYYKIRALDRDLSVYKRISDVEKSARLIYLNKTCYNGLYRVNSKGQFNTPIGKYENPKIYDENNINQISQYLNTAHVEIKNMDFVDAVQKAKRGDFLYFDPPYDYEEQGFAHYQKEGFGVYDLNRLKETCDHLINKGCHVLISNHATTRVLSLFNNDNYEVIDVNYEIHRINVKRYIGSKVEQRKMVGEVLIHGYKK